jgi:hypothetical protein
MNNWICCILLLASGCISKHDDNAVTFFQKRLEKIELYSDSTLELVSTIYPIDEYVYESYTDSDMQRDRIYLKMNGKTIWEMTLKFERGDNSIYLTNVPEYFKSPDYISSLSLEDNKSLVFIYKGDCTYIMDRSHLLGEPWMYVNNEEYNGNVLFGDQVYFCFKPLE